MIVHLHLGLHKTGTTTIQNALYAARERLAEHGWLYPHMPPYGANHSSAFYLLFARNPETYFHHLSRGGDLARKRADARAALEAALSSGADHVVFSGEDIGWIEGNGFDELIALLRARTQEVRVIAYVREPVSYAVSMFQELMRYGRRLEEQFAAPPLPHIRARLAPFRDAFGPAQCKILPFETGISADLVARFCAEIGMSEDVAAVVGPSGQDNRAMGAEAVELLDIANEEFPAVLGGRRNWTRAPTLTRWLDQIEGGPFTLPAQSIDFVRRETADDLAWLEELWGTPPFAHAPTPAPGNFAPAWSRASKRSLVRRLNQLLLHIAGLEGRIRALNAELAALKAQS